MKSSSVVRVATTRWADEVTSPPRRLSHVVARLLRVTTARVFSAQSHQGAPSHGYATTVRECGCATASSSKTRLPSTRDDDTRREDEKRRKNKNQPLARAIARTSGVHALLIIRSSSMTYATIDRRDDGETARG